MASARNIAFVAALIAAASSTSALAETVVEKGMIRFQLGEQHGANAEILIKPRFNARHVIMLELRRAARPGARVVLTVDDAATAVFSSTLRREQCADRQGVPVCTIVVPGHGPHADAIVDAFKAGRLVRVAVMDGMTAMMQSSASVMGFTAAFRMASR